MLYSVELSPYLIYPPLHSTLKLSPFTALLTFLALVSLLSSLLFSFNQFTTHSHTLTSIHNSITTVTMSFNVRISSCLLTRHSDPPKLTLLLSAFLFTSRLFTISNNNH